MMDATPCAGAPKLSPLITLCGKMDMLDRMLLRLKAEGHKVGVVCVIDLCVQVCLCPCVCMCLCLCDVGWSVCVPHLSVSAVSAYVSV